MKRLLFLVGSFLLATSSALAVNTATSDGTKPIIIFRNHADRTLEIVCAPASNYTDADDDVYDFTAVNGDNSAANYLNSNGSYSYNPVVEPPAPAPLTASQAVANVSQLEVDLWNDSVTKPIIGNLIIYYPLLEKNLSLTATAQDNVMCQEFWLGLKANPPSWLTSAVISAIESHAAADNVALVAPSSGQ